MGIIIKNNELVIIAKPKPFYFDSPKNVGNNLKLEINFIIKQKFFLALHTIKSKVGQLLSKYNHGNNIHKHRKQ